MKFSDDMVRRIGALSGLAIGFGLMYAIGQVDLVRAFVFGVSGCLIGSSIAQRYAKTRRQGSIELPDEQNATGDSKSP